MKKLQASLIFFTRFPFWRIWKPESEYFSRVVDLWSLTGWLTGGLSALLLYGLGQIMPIPCAVVITLIFRVIITGGLHEDGFADFFDGFGGGRTREDILRIMKDSHIGSYGVVALILFFILSAVLLASLPLQLSAIVCFAGDTWGKFCSSQIINILPYARSCEQVKAKMIYTPMTPAAFIISLFAGAVPVLLLPYWEWLSCVLPLIVLFISVAIMRRRLMGYTGDCCGAVFLLCELGFRLSAVIIYSIALC